MQNPHSCRGAALELVGIYCLAQGHFRRAEAWEGEGRTWQERQNICKSAPEPQKSYKLNESSVGGKGKVYTSATLQHRKASKIAGSLVYSQQPSEFILLHQHYCILITCDWHILNIKKKDQPDEKYCDVYITNII